MTRATLYLVSVGPGDASLIAPAAIAAIDESSVVVAYDLYLTWVRERLQGKEIITMPLTQEKARVQAAIDAARAGKTVALLSSGDIGIYGLAPLLFEEVSESEPFAIKVIPGISASNACASLLGAPLAHDFVTISLSDLLCPWEWIEKRAQAAAEADLCVAMYNVQSKKRFDGIYKVLEIFARHKAGHTVCGVVRNTYRPDQSISVTTLAELSKMTFDMFTTIIIGNRFTTRRQQFMFTPRGYNSWLPTSQSGVTPQSLPAKSLWVFSGTSDGNELANHIAKETKLPVVVSVATDYGEDIARKSCPDLTIVSGSIGAPSRAKLLSENAARGVIDATHPFAQNISEQLRSICAEHEIPYIRFERASRAPEKNVFYCDSIVEAVDKAAELGKRVFLATGSKCIDDYLAVPSTRDRNLEWFVRIAPDAESMRKVIAAGIARERIVAMQGPFSSALNESLWKQWQIDVLITKDSGTAGGLEEKLMAARALSLPVVVLRRPPPATSCVTSFSDVLTEVRELCQL